MDLRRWHRRLATAIGLLLLYWVCTGLMMATFDATDRLRAWSLQGGGPGAPLNRGAASAPAIPDPAELAAGIAAGQSAMGLLAIASVDLRQVPQGLRLQFAEANGSRDTMGQFEATTGQAMSESVAEAAFPDAALAADAARRGALKSWHKGDAGGLAGQALGVLAGLSLLTMAVTGLLLYFQIRSARRGMHRKKYFWSGKESRWRMLHRWVALVAAVFLLNIAVSGTVLAIGEFKLNLFLHHHIGTPPYPKPMPMPPVSAAALPSDLNAMLRTVYSASRRQEPGGRIVALQLVVRDGLPKGLATFGGAAPHTVAFDALTGAAATDWASGGVQAGAGYFGDWHQYLKRMHRGDIVSHFAGRYFDLAAGLAFLYLVVSGLVMVLQQRRRRLTIG